MKTLLLLLSQSILGAMTFTAWTSITKPSISLTNSKILGREWRAQGGSHCIQSYKEESFTQISWKQH